MPSVNKKRHSQNAFLSDLLSTGRPEETPDLFGVDAKILRDLLYGDFLVFEFGIRLFNLSNDSSTVAYAVTGEGMNVVGVHNNFFSHFYILFLAS
ncbi:hypothetical protein [Kaistella sp.]|uniref:hypothetical protein n=1 Tax=Kaistella sp. TaxID=2782235 RepID=UPI002F91DACD